MNTFQMSAEAFAFRDGAGMVCKLNLAMVIMETENIELQRRYK
jgi:hypothetical protein